MVLQRISLDYIESIRSHKWRTGAKRRLRDETDALRFIEELGFVLLMPITGAEMPNMRIATQRDWVWWDWKQTLPEQRACYYAKLIRRRGTFVSWDCFPLFHAVQADRRPYWRQYRKGMLSREEKQILDLLADRGPLMTRELRLAFGPSSKQNTHRVKTILVDLQSRFLIAATGGSTEGWSHHRWDLVDRWAPAGVLQNAANMKKEEACRCLLQRVVDTLVATTPADIAWLLGWEREKAQIVAEAALDREMIQHAVIEELNVEMLVSKSWQGEG